MSGGFDIPAKRRKEIIRHALHVGAAQTEDFSRWLVVWVMHNRNAIDQIWSLMEAANREDGRPLTFFGAIGTQHDDILADLHRP